MSTITSLAPILAVKNVAKAAEYFQNQLGFTISFVIDEPGLAGYGVVYRDEYDIHLMENEERDSTEILFGINTGVTDVDALYEEFRERGAFHAEFPRTLDIIREHPPEDKEYGMRDMIFINPQGYILVFGQDL
ncbi:MAG: VOC family protein [Pseudomonadota bacterium]